MTVVTQRLRQLCAVAAVVGTFGITASTALADLHDTSGRGHQERAWKAPAPEGYPSGWNVTSAPAPQVYDYRVGTGTTSLKATGQATPPPQNAQVIYQMVPGGHRYHRITQ